MNFIINVFVLFVLIVFAQVCANAKIDSKSSENQKQYGKELVTKQFSDDKKDFAGKKIYQCPYYGWQVEILYRDGKSISETARPKGDKVKKEIITESEANLIADLLYPRKERGPYRKQIKNANFISHFFEHGVVSYEMRLDKRRKKQIGISPETMSHPYQTGKQKRVGQ